MNVLRVAKSTSCHVTPCIDHHGYKKLSWRGSSRLVVKGLQEEVEMEGGEGRTITTALLQCERDHGRRSIERRVLSQPAEPTCATSQTKFSFYQQKKRQKLLIHVCMKFNATSKK